MNKAILDEQLEQLNIKLATMCRLVEKMLQDAVNALRTADKKLADEVVKSDEKVNAAELEIEHTCLQLLLMQHPFAKDFRELSTILKVITDIERIGDQAADIAGLVENNSSAMDWNATHIPSMCTLAIKMVHDAVDSFLTRNEQLADATAKLDDSMDTYFTTVRTELANHLRQNADCAEAWLTLLMVAKYFERVGDHAVNICEWTDYQARGTHTKFE